MENIKNDATIAAQYIGTTSGLTRLFPMKKWIIDPEPITIDLFDPRFRPWFVNAQSAPKDVIFLIDMSGSVKGQTVHLIRMTVLHILATLSPNDYINAIWFNSRQVPVLRGCFDGFIPAMTRNKRDEVNFTDAWNETWIASSGGHKLIMLFTDGSENRGPSAVESRRNELDKDTV
ncbi:unnamed protein product [Gongylonema pulchrum]|uniref:VWFA domain-containing protein n=1 Tax=Gongylonema pulchrum TaxID=637853 RepID=A0A3P7NAY9_9BILA|nr:unnamed protein product [Gongylonema pulchrum]